MPWWKRLLCRVIGHRWEVSADRYEAVMECSRCETCSSLYSGRWDRREIEDALATLGH